MSTMDVHHGRIGGRVRPIPRIGRIAASRTSRLSLPILSSVSTLDGGERDTGSGRPGTSATALAVPTMGVAKEYRARAPPAVTRQHLLSGREGQGPRPFPLSPRGAAVGAQSVDRLRVSARGSWVTPACVAAGGGALVAAAPLTPATGLVSVAGSAVVASGMVGAAVSSRSARRQQLVSDVRLALTAVTGPGTQVKAQWRGKWVGNPSRLVIRYDPGAKSGEKEWAQAVVSTCRTRLGVPLVVAVHDQRRRRLVLKAPAKAAGGQQVTEARERAERTVLKLLGPTSRVVDVDVEQEQVVRVRAVHEDPTRFATSGHRARLERTLSEVMPGRWRGVWQMEKDTVTFEVRPPLPDQIWLPPRPAVDAASLLQDYAKVAIPYGRSEDGDELTWVPSKVPHVIVTGGTGSGKTSTTYAFVAAIAGHGWPVWISDAKQVEFLEFRDYPNVQFVATDLPDQVAMIYRARQLVEYRYDLIKRGQARVEDFEPVLVVLDEFAEMRDDLLEWYGGIKVRGDEAKPPTLKHVARLARKARTARVHLLIALQRPDAAFLTGEMRDNFRLRISLGPLSPQGAMMMWDNPSTGVTLPAGKTGRCMATTASGRVVEAQAYRFPDLRTTDPEQQKVLASLRPNEARQERLLFAPATETPDLAWPKEKFPEGIPTNELRFDHFMRAGVVRAVDRPDLDPLQQLVASNVPGVELASPMTMFGLGEHAAPVVPALVDERTGSASEEPEPHGEASAAEDIEALYLEPDAVPLADLEVGDLILVDEPADTWAVLQYEPDEDPEGIGLCWRDFAGQEGLLVVSDEDWVQRRRPILETPYGEALPD